MKTDHKKLKRQAQLAEEAYCEALLRLDSLKAQYEATLILSTRLRTEFLQAQRDYLRAKNESRKR